MAETILITGSNRGLGLALTREFAERGWQVLACCRTPEAAVELQQLAERKMAIRILPLEVTDSEQIHQLAETLHQEPIDILFNNAGIFGPPDQDFGELDEAWWLETLRINLIAPMKIIEALIGNVTASRRRIVVTMGSLLGCLTDNTTGGMHMHRTSKAAVHMLMRGLAGDLRERGVVSVAIHPGWVRTRIGGPLAPLEPFESAEGIARVLLGLDIASSGKLLSFEGKELAW